ncbi:MAG: hypothetical protein R8F63_05790 [Acidimicrobiales bacterium]|nr:hypothetical protein [Acidimicrobiales bacterium]
MRVIAGLLVGSLLVAACADDSTTSDTAPVVDETTTAPTTTAPPTTAAPTTTAAPATPLTPAQSVVELDGEIVDDTRGRSIPYRAYAPVGVEGAVPVVLVSHGGFGSDTGYTRGTHLGGTFAADGFLAIHVGHRRSAAGDRQVFDRPADVTALLDALGAGELELPPAFTGTPDLERVGHVGHSYGAYTSHAVGGAVFDRDLTDPRIDAIVPISPAGHDQFGAFDDGAGNTTWSTVTIPAFNLIGGEEMDINAVGTIERPGWRRVPFDNYPDEGDKYLVVIDGQTHSDMWRTGASEVAGFIAAEISDFLAVYVAGDTSVDACDIGIGDLGYTTLERSPAADADCRGAE